MPRVGTTRLELRKPMVEDDVAVDEAGRQIVANLIERLSRQLGVRQFDHG